MPSTIAALNDSSSRGGCKSPKRSVGDTVGAVSLSALDNQPARISGTILHSWVFNEFGDVTHILFRSASGNTSPERGEDQ